MIRPIHPFPARMAPEIALAQLKILTPGSLVLDPMAGSGTVVRHATHLGHRALGYDLDPLAVLMARVWTRPIIPALNADAIAELLRSASLTKAENAEIPGIDGDPKTQAFIEYWFDKPQRDDLRRLVSAINEVDDRDLADFFRVALSRIIITKDRGASLARDVSHSRPHKSWATSDFDVLPAFERSATRVVQLLSECPPKGDARVSNGDARKLTLVENKSVDMVLTSPPYLNAIDYMRGHRLSLVWFGHSVGKLSTVRSSSIGAERAPDARESSESVTPVARAMCAEDGLPRAELRMVDRYAGDLLDMLREVARVLKPGGRAVMVIGDSFIKGTFVRNSDGVAKAAAHHGLVLLDAATRELPNRSRYLPMPQEGSETSLGRRMRTETVLTFTA